MPYVTPIPAHQLDRFYIIKADRNRGFIPPSDALTLFDELYREREAEYAAMGINVRIKNYAYASGFGDSYILDPSDDHSELMFRMRFYPDQAAKLNT